MAAALGRRMGTSTASTVPIVTQLVGASIERLALNAMDPASGVFEAELCIPVKYPG